MVRLVRKIIIVHFSDPFCAEFLLIQNLTTIHLSFTMLKLYALDGS